VACVSDLILYGLFVWAYGPIGVIAATAGVAGCLGMRALAARDGTKTRALIALLAGLVVVAIVLIVPGPTTPTVESPGPTEETNNVAGSAVRTLVISVVRHQDVTTPMEVPVDDGGLCLPYGAFGPWEIDGPYLIVTDHTGRVGGVLDIGQGRWETGPEGSRCVARVGVALPDAPFYTFTVADVYQRTVIRSVLEAAGWTYEIEVDAR
jgi:hypothetical protein